MLKTLLCIAYRPCLALPTEILTGQRSPVNAADLEAQPIHYAGLQRTVCLAYVPSVLDSRKSTALGKLHGVTASRQTTASLFDVRLRNKGCWHQNAASQLDFDTIQAAGGTATAAPYPPRKDELVDDCLYL